VGTALHSAGIKQLNPLNPTHLWALRSAMPPYAKWWLGEKLLPSSKPKLPAMPDSLRAHAEYASAMLRASALEISSVMSKHQLKLPDRQCRMSEVSLRVQKFVTMLCTALYASRQSDEVVRQAADVLCQDLKRETTGRRPSDTYFRAVTKLGDTIADGGFKSIAGVQPDEILMPYSQ